MPFRHLAATLCLLAVWTPPPAAAHPHIFVDAALEIVFDASGQPSAVRISWVYDPLFSMLLLSDMGLDDDFDGALTAEEHAALEGFDMNWIEGYHGDTHVSQGDQALALGGPEETTSGFVDGRLRSSHLRQLQEQPDPGQPWEVSVHDPSYYTLYSLSRPPVLTGAPNCSATVIAPDMEKAQAELANALDERAVGGADIEADFPAVGALFAEKVRITCPAL